MSESSTHKVLLTGASGFVGRTLATMLADQGVDLVSVHRRPPTPLASGRIALIEDISADTDWQETLPGITAVVHLAALAHVTDRRNQPTLDTFRRINTGGAIRLAEAAAAAGVRRFVFLSSIGVNGDYSGRPFGPSSPECPTESYAVSKLEAEQALRSIARRTQMQVVIVRAPMVYGEACTGNLLRLLEAIHSRVPLPFGFVRNRRSLVGVHNLCAFLATCVKHERAGNLTFSIADEPDISTPDLIRVLAQGMGVHARLVPVPMLLLEAAARLAGRHRLLEKICGDLRIDTSLPRELLGWRQPMALEAGLLAVGRWYLSRSLC